jgi:hypothetical protein
MIALPHLVWQALVTHHHESDWWALVDNAERRNQPMFAEALLQLKAKAGDSSAALRLATLLAGQGRPNLGLSLPVDHGVWHGSLILFRVGRACGRGEVPARWPGSSVRCRRSRGVRVSRSGVVAR